MTTSNKNETKISMSWGISLLGFLTGTIGVIIGIPVVAGVLIFHHVGLEAFYIFHAMIAVILCLVILFLWID
jgi:uncharacterized protein YacL